MGMRTGTEFVGAQSLRPKGAKVGAQSLRPTRVELLFFLPLWEETPWREKPSLGGKTYFGEGNLLWAGKPTLGGKTYFGEENLLWRGKPTLGGETPFGRGNPLCVGKPLVGKPPLRRETPCRETPFGRGNPAPTCPSPQFFSLALRSQLARFTFTIPSGV